MSESIITFPAAPDDLSIHAFADWLNQFTPHQIVGRGGDARACPIACFLASQGHDHPFVDETETRFGDPAILWPDRPSRTNPAWAQRFIARIDHHTGISGHGIQARTARRILTEVIEEVGDDIE